ncbi:MAG TPA: PQQ-binding-like beta-propeller repeat protein [Thermoanaerobaculia bacterium]|nr:PQQ-binding-like beta-propeller repeat protein [Thermoanaerobaculia bacterium]
MPRRLTLVLSALILIGARPDLPVTDVVDYSGWWTQFGGGVGGRKPRSVITQQNVHELNIAWQTALPEPSDGSPVYVSGVETRRGTLDLLVVNTTTGRLVAFNANNGALVWQTTPPEGPRWTTSSPAVDPTGTFVFGYSLDGYVHRYELATGQEAVGNGFPALITLKGDVEKGSSNITIATARNRRTFLYMTIAAYPDPGDDGDYQGHLVTVDINSGEHHVFNALCSDADMHFALGDCYAQQAGIWARAGAVYDPVTDRVFVTTGNGPNTALDGGHDWGSSVVALRPDGTTDRGEPLDSYTPENFQELTDEDLDLSSTGIEPLPHVHKNWPRLGVQSGKDGRLRLLNLENLSGAGGPAHIGGELQILDLPQGDEVLTQPQAWLDGRKTWVFIADNRGIAAIELVASEDGDPQLVLRWKSDLGGTTPVIVNCVLYLAAPHRLVALRPTTGAVLWKDNTIGDIHWQSPIIVNNMVYLSENAGYVTAYSLPRQ